MSSKQLAQESYNKEALLVGILWNNPDMFDVYDEAKINRKVFGNPIWAFYMGVARYLFQRNYTVFSDITVQTAVNELKLNQRYEKYGGYEIIEELMEETKNATENFEGYYDEVKKYALLREYYQLFGPKVLEPTDVYDYKKLSRNAISMYWNDKINNIDMEHNETSIVAHDLLADLGGLIESLDIDPDLGMPFYKARKLTDIINGWANGTLSIISAFSGNGKTSFMIEKLFMACINEGEKLAIIANEQDLAQYQKLLLITIMGSEMYEVFKDHFGERVRFNRKSINKGNFTPEERMKLEMAVDWIEEKIDDKSLIKFIPLEDYTMDNVEKVVKKFTRRGYTRWIVDTAKPSEGGRKERWQQFVEDFDRLYKLARKDGGGLNLAMFATVQAADTHVGKYWLNEQCLADGKKIKNVADLVWHLRPVHPQEFQGGAFELEVINWKPKKDDMFNNDEGTEDDFSITTEDGTQLIKHKVTLKQGRVYYLLFTSKNRRGMTNLTGLDVLVLEVDFNSNRWKEIGWSKNIRRDDFV